MRAIEGRWLRWVVVALALGFLRACSLETEAPAPGPCNETGCDDGNPCSEDLCASDGYCDHLPLNLVPDDGNPCTEDECVDSSEQHIAAPDGATCGLDGVLECQAGKCLCTKQQECGESTVCVTFACEDGACTAASAPMGTPVDGAEPGDCKLNVCDGAGAIDKAPDESDVPADSIPGDCRAYACSAAGEIVEVPANGDVPPGDDNLCTIEGCNGGAPVEHVPESDGTPCGSPGTCGEAMVGFAETPQPACLGGTCAPPVAKSCGLYACNDAGDGCRGLCQDNADCADYAYCYPGTQLCVPQGDFGQRCAADVECTSASCVDEVCCTTDCAGPCRQCDLPGLVGICSNVPAGQDPDDECAGAETCNGTTGCAKPQGSPCGRDGECLGAQCEDGVCCNSDCPGACRRCDLPATIGTCSNVAMAQAVPGCDTNGHLCNGAGLCNTVNGTPCAAGAECLSGFCPSEDGDPKVCCDEACNGECESCLASKTGGANGVCKLILAKTDPDNECIGNCFGALHGCCDGNGHCGD